MYWDVSELFYCENVAYDDLYEKFWLSSFKTINFDSKDRTGRIEFKNYLLKKKVQNKMALIQTSLFVMFFVTYFFIMFVKIECRMY